MKYFLWFDEKKQGPYEPEQIRELLSRGVVAPNTLGLEEGGADHWGWYHLPSLIGPAKPPPPAVMSYYILQDDEAKGPYTIGQLRSMWSSGSITAKTMHRQECDSEWHPLSTILHQLEPPAATVVTQQSVVVVTARKSRGVYIILGLLLGLLGIHNFYAGHNREGACQLIITLTFIGLVITIPWVLIDICTIITDGDGNKMT